MTEEQTRELVLALQGIDEKLGVIAAALSDISAKVGTLDLRSEQWSPVEYRGPDH